MVFAVPGSICRGQHCVEHIVTWLGLCRLDWPVQFQAGGKGRLVSTVCQLHVGGSLLLTNSWVGGALILTVGCSSKKSRRFVAQVLVSQWGSQKQQSRFLPALEALGAVAQE